LKYIKLTSKAQKRVVKQMLYSEWGNNSGKSETRYQKDLLQIALDNIKIHFILGNYQKTIKYS